MVMRSIFQGFCINQFGIGPLHYISSSSDFGSKIAEIFVIETDSPTQWVRESAIEYENSPLQWVGESSIIINLQNFK